MSSAASERSTPAAAGTHDPGKQYRAKSGIPVIPALDGFRAFAILGIVLLHLSGTLESSGMRILVFGTLPNMVDVLFIVSGFVVFLPTVARGGEFGSVGAYALRRGARLLPAFWLAIVVVLVMLALWPLSPAPAFPGVVDIGAHFLGLQGIGHFLNPDFDLGLVIDGPLWTLTLELTFYVLLPLVAARYFRRPLLGLAIAALITVGWKLGFAHSGSILSLFGFHPDPVRLQWLELRAYGQFPAYAFQFALGMTAAWALVRWRSADGPGTGARRALIERRAVFAQLASLAVFAYCAYRFGLHAKENTILAPTQARQDIILTLILPFSLATFMLATCLAPRRAQIPFALPFARRLGDISYGIYLIHLPLILYVTSVFAPTAPHIGPIGGIVGLALIVVPLAILYGFLSARLLEQPIRRWAHKFGRRGGATPPPVEPTAAASGTTPTAAGVGPGG